MLASEVLRFDERNTEAEDLLAAPDDHGEIRRLTIMFADVVDSTVLSTWVEPEVYRTLVGRYRHTPPAPKLPTRSPFALAAKALDPGNQKRVVVLSGDGSFGLNGFDFESCVRFGFKVTVIVGNDAAWGQIRGPQVMIFGSERAPATKLAPVRYDRVVEAFGGVGFHVEDAAAALSHLLDLAGLQSLYLGNDDLPALETEVVAWIRRQEGLPVLPAADETPSGRRVSNARLRIGGWSPRFPDYASGYLPLLAKPGV